MIVQFISGETVQIGMNPFSSVADLKGEIGMAVNFPVDCLVLSIEGNNLVDNRTLSSYDVHDSSIIMVEVKPAIQDNMILKQEKEVEEYLISMCKRCAPIPPPNEMPKDQENAEEEMRQFDQICKEGVVEPTNMDVDDLLPYLLGNDEILSKLTRTGFFKTILMDLQVARQVIFAHPLIGQLFETNPGLKECFEEDETLRSIIAVMCTPHSVIKMRKREAMNRIIFPKLGRDIKLSPEHLEFAEKKRQGMLLGPRLAPAMNELQKKAFITIIRRHPDILARFLKTTPLYRFLIHKNPQLLNAILKPEHFKNLFSVDSMSKVMEIYGNIRSTSKEKQSKT